MSCVGLKHQKIQCASLFQIGVDRIRSHCYPTVSIFDRLFHRFLSKSTYVSETNVYGVSVYGILAITKTNLLYLSKLAMKN